MTLEQFDSSFTLEQIAERLHVSRATVNIYVKAGELKATKLGKRYYVTPADLDAFMEKGGPSVGYYHNYYVRKGQKKWASEESRADS